MLYSEVKSNQKQRQKQRSSTVSIESTNSNQSQNTYSDNPILKFRCQITFVEIYKDIIYDLLPPTDLNGSSSSSTTTTSSNGKGNNNSNNKNINLPVVQILESSSDEYGGTGQLILKNVNVYETTTEEEALSLYFLGMNNRNTSSTSMNISSSRSHAIFTIIVETETLRDNKTISTRGKINLVDLAGSERMYKVIF